MQVYVVMGGWDYEGADNVCPGLFDCKSTAYAAAERLKVEGGYDWVEVTLQSVNMESALASA